MQGKSCERCLKAAEGMWACPMWANTVCLAWNSHAIHGTPETESLPSYLMTNFNPYTPVECRQSDINCLKVAAAAVVMFARMQIAM